MLSPSPDKQRKNTDVHRRRDDAFEPYRLALGESGNILRRHLLVFVNAVIFSVVALLFVFGDLKSAIFLGIIVVINVFLGVAQDFRARVALERLQLLTAVRFTRVNEDNSEESVFPEEIMVGDLLSVKLGDQIPCDGVLSGSKALEISEALLTGESEPIPKSTGDDVLAGDIVTAGSGTVQVKTLYADSRIAKMTASSKRYVANPSPIQRAVETIIRYSGYTLAVILVIIGVRGYLAHEQLAAIIMHAGALASMIVPQGLIVTTTLFFAFGAASYSRRKVLYQDINATEKLGRIKNLCMDKTGTLTENFLEIENMYLPQGREKEAVGRLIVRYIGALGETSQTIGALGKYLRPGELSELPGEAALDVLPFSSWRRYGAVTMASDGGIETIAIGAPDVLSQYLMNEEERAWLRSITEKHAQEGKHLLAVIHASGVDVRHAFSEPTFSILCAFVFRSGFREGVQEAVNFFQDRGVHIRIISGDNLETVRAVALASGVHYTDDAVTGAEMNDWTDVDYAEKAKSYSIFARVLPEQKVKLIEALKEDGFTAMVGDGANDALAIKSADLGIAMFDGAKATRQLAAVVLMNNSFTALPGAVRLADNFIENIEIFATTFLNQSFLGLYFFLIISGLGYATPVTPLNVTLINYFTVGLPAALIAYWAIRPTGDIRPATSENFLKRVVPLAALLGAIEAIGTAFVFFFSPEYLKTAETNTLVLLAFIFFGLIFFVLTSKLRHKIITGAQQLQFLGLCVVELLLGITITRIAFFVDFFNINYRYPSATNMERFFLIIAVSGAVLYFFTKLFFTPRPNKTSA